MILHPLVLAEEKTMLDIRKHNEALNKLEHNQCIDRGHTKGSVLGGVSHCAFCGAILGNVTHLYRTWRRCVESLGLKPKGHEYGR